MRERADNRWLLLAWSAAASERHLWSVWTATANRWIRQTNTARSPDAEFFRILAGTHQIRTGFERAGLRAGDERAWLVHLPSIEHALTGDPPLDSMPASLPTVGFDADEIEAADLMTCIGADLEPARPVPSAAGLVRIGAASADDPSLPEATPGELESRFIAHATACDIAKIGLTPAD